MQQIFPLLFLLFLAGCTSLGTVGSKDIATLNTERKPLAAKVEDIETFFTQIFTNDLKKSQFETKVEYTSRLQRLQPASTNFLFKVDPVFVEYVYNAEKQTLVVMLPPRLSYNSFERPSQPAFLIHMGDQTPQTPATEKARTLAAARASRTSYKPYELRILNFLELPLNTRWRKTAQQHEAGLGLAVVIPSEAAKAAVAKKSISLILGVTIGDLCTEGSFSSEKPALDKSYELPVRITHLAAVDQSTGYVLASWSKDR